MKTLPPLILWLCLNIAAGDEAGFRKRIEKAKEGNNGKAWAEATAEWKAAEPKSPEPLIAEANRLFHNAGTVQIDAGLPGKNDFELKDPGTGKTTGRITAGSPDQKLTGEALAVLRHALDLAPDRLDIRGGMAYLCQESGRYDEELEILKQMTKHALAHPSKQRWSGGAVLDKPVEKFVPEKLHSYGLYHYNQQTPEGDKRFGAIAELATVNYPGDPVGWNDLALFRYLAQKDLKGAAGCLEKAAAIDPSDGVVQFNLARFYTELKQPDKAKAIYQEIIRTSKDQDDVDSAREKLMDLGGENRKQD